MSKRFDKKKLKRQADTTTAVSATTQSAAAATAPTVSASVTPVVTNEPAVTDQIDFIIQYRSHEYLEKDIIEKIKEKCREEGKEFVGSEKLSVYLKPEDHKAYFTYAGFSSFIEV